MKKNFLSLIGIALISSSLFLTSCGGDEETPVITLTGGETTTWSLQKAWVDPGFTANDNKDGDVTSLVTVTGTVDVNKTGDYTLTYEVADEKGNKGTATRKVTVKNDAAKYDGTYSVVIKNLTNTSVADYSYNATLASSTTVNNRITNAKLGDYANAAVYFNITGTAIDLPSQTVTAGTPSASRTFVGVSAESSVNSTGNILTVVYNETTGGTTTKYRETYTKQ